MKKKKGACVHAPLVFHKFSCVREVQRPSNEKIWRKNEQHEDEDLTWSPYVFFLSVLDKETQQDTLLSCPNQLKHSRLLFDCDGVLISMQDRKLYRQSDQVLSWDSSLFNSAGKELICCYKSSSGWITVTGYPAPWGPRTTGERGYLHMILEVRVAVLWTSPLLLLPAELFLSNGKLML